MRLYFNAKRQLLNNYSNKSDAKLSGTKGRGLSATLYGVLLRCSLSVRFLIDIPWSILGTKIGVRTNSWAEMMVEEMMHFHSKRSFNDAYNDTFTGSPVNERHQLSLIEACAREGRWDVALQYIQQRRWHFSVYRRFPPFSIFVQVWVRPHNTYEKSLHLHKNDENVKRCGPASKGDGDKRNLPIVIKDRRDVQRGCGSKILLISQACYGTCIFLWPLYQLGLLQSRNVQTGFPNDFLHGITRTKKYQRATRVSYHIPEI